MFIKFNYLKFKNISSYGNNLTTFDFHKGFHLLSAPNGSGKSSIIEALTYCLFGKPYRNINLSELINRTNKRELYTECNFNIGSDSYTIIRTMKPDSLKILKNDQPLSLLSSKKLDQDEIDKILGIDYKMFKKIMSLAVNYNKPYFMMSAQEKRDTIESIFNIKIFGEMEKVVKKKISALKTEISIADSTLKVMEGSIETQRKQLKDLKQLKENFNTEKIKSIETTKKIIENSEFELKDIDNKIITLQPKINELIQSTSELSSLKSKQNELYQKLSELETQKTNFKNETEKKESIVVDLVKVNGEYLEIQTEIENLKTNLKEKEYYDIDKLRSESNELISQISTIKAKISQIDDELKFLETDICPTCKRELDEKYKDSERNRLNEKKNELSLTKKNNEDRKAELDKLIKDQTLSNKEYDELKNKIKLEENNLKTFSNKIKDLSEKQNILEESLKKYDIQQILSDCDNIKKDLKEISDKFDDLEKKNKEKGQLEIELNTLMSKKIYAEKNIQDSKNKLIELENKKFEMDLEAIQKDFDLECEKYSNLYSENDKKNKKLTNYRLICDLLSADGIKAFFLKKLIPILNQSVNGYLQKFDLPIRLEFNEKM
ncbi:MAG TPA: AAA family ATPase, partial [Caldisericia bacterium]|nr:AAA family ATPase [Caldisericia bacterium]